MKTSKRTRNVVLAGGLCGIITFLFIFGYRILDVTYVEWLYNKGDLTQHYNGWEFFRHSKWYFPIGLMDTATYPEKVSVIYSDSIPLLAIPLKLLSPLLPEPFQYLGLWGAACYILQGVIAGCILQKYIRNWPVLIISIFTVTFTPWTLQRLYMHTSLAGHWILLLCILLCLNGQRLSIYKNTIYWSLLFVTSSLVHIYYIPMCVVFLGCVTLYRMFLNHKKRRNLGLQLITALIPIFAAYVILWIAGAFYGPVQFGKDALGEGGANLNFLFNPVGKSAFLPSLPNPLAKWTEESFGYLGLGGFLLILSCIGLLILNKKVVEYVKRYKLELVFTTLAVVIFLWLATAPVVAFNEHLLFRWLLPFPIYRLLNIFRSLGRFVWPICYILLFGAIVGIHAVLCGKKGKKLALTILLLSLCLQIADFRIFIRDKNSFVNQSDGYPEFHREIWDLFIKDYQHIYVFGLDRWQELGSYAAERGLTISETYLARRNDEMIIERNKKTAKELQRGIADEKTLYILPPGMDSKALQSLKQLYIYQIDGFYVATVDSLSIDSQYKVKVE